MLPLEELAPVLVDASLGKLLLQRLEASEVDVGHGNELERGMRGERLEIGQGLAGSADTGVPNRAARTTHPCRYERGGGSSTNCL